MFAWRGFTVEQSKVQRVGPFDEEAPIGHSGDGEGDSSCSSEQEEELEISPEWKQRIVEAHNSMKQKQAQRTKEDKNNKEAEQQNSTESMELELKQGFETALLAFGEQQKRLQRT